MDYYEQQKSGLGDKFYIAVEDTIKAIAKTPHFAIRYNDVRCLLVKKYMYMIHYQINENNNTATIRALINTKQDPSTNWIK
jgi:hypothetical protein